MKRDMRSVLAVGLLVVSAGLVTANPAGATAVLFVDINDSTCSDLGPGTTTDPYCHIGAALKLAQPGDTVSVDSGKYREQLTFPRSGTVDAPITVRATTSGVTVLGSQDVSDPAQWTATSGTAWSRTFNRTARQVFVDQTRLLPAPDLASLTPGAFWYDTTAKVLHVDLGGDNPGVGHLVEAGAESYGFNTTGRSYVAVIGMSARYQNYYGVLASGGTGVTVARMSVSYTGSYGIRVDTSTATQVLDSGVRRSGSHGILVKDASGVLVARNATDHNLLHGLELQGTNDSVVTGNRSWSNAKPGSRVSNGLDVGVGSSRNLITGNTFWDNQDSGLQVYNGSNDNVVTRNVSYRNGDHGFDTYNATGTRYLGNTSYDNSMDGISIEGNAHGTRTANNVVAENGGYELYVDRTSFPSWMGDRDLFWRTSTSTPFKLNGVKYANTNALARGTEQEGEGRWADPLFRDGVLPDLHLTVTSPAVDRADVTVDGYQLTDNEGTAPFDVLDVKDKGLGSPRFADLGAFEFSP